MISLSGSNRLREIISFLGRTGYFSHPSAPLYEICYLGSALFTKTGTGKCFRHYHYHRSEFCCSELESHSRNLLRHNRCRCHEESGILAVGRDITERKKAEEKLKKSEKFYRTLIADSLDVTLLLNEKGEIIFTTPAIHRLLGYEREEVLSTNAFQYIHPEDLAWAIQSFEKEVEENPEIKFIIVRVLQKSGSWLWCMIRGHNLLDNPDINAIAIYLHDDTPRKMAHVALQESEKRFRSLVRDLHVGVLVQNREGRIEMTNQAMCRMFDTTEEVLLGGKIWEIYDDVIHEDGRIFLQYQ
ncbi:MAG: PAS domain S-box protein [Chitinophagaceae bacterium]|nr:MAG: PAS domain S-box protein [Chitinophagaceae bacterium]